MINIPLTDETELAVNEVEEALGLHLALCDYFGFTHGWKIWCWQTAPKIYTEKVKLTREIIYKLDIYMPVYVAVSRHTTRPDFVGKWAVTCDLEDERVWVW